MPPRSRLLIPLLIVLIAVCCYWPGLSGPFLFDDFPNLAALKSIDHLSSWRDLGVYLSQSRNFPGRPLAMLSFLAQQAYWPEHPFPFKLANLCLHLLNGLLVFRLSWLLARHYLDQRANDVDGGAWWTASLVMAAFLWHPIQMSPVLLVIQRMTLLMTLFTLLGLLGYLHALQATQRSLRYRAFWMASSLGACMLLALLCKENGILLPLYVLVLDHTLLREPLQHLARPLRHLRRLLLWPPLIFLVLYLIWNAVVNTERPPAIRDFTLWQRLLTEPRILLDYLGKTLLPHFGVYGLYHDAYTISRSLFTPWSTLPSLLAIAAALVTGLAWRRRYPLLALGVLWYLGGQVIESGPLLLELYFEHRNYLPLLGPFIAVALAVTGLANFAYRKRATLASATWLLACLLASNLSARIWASEDHLAQAWSAQQPDSRRAATMLGDRMAQHGLLDQAAAHIDGFLEKHPDALGLAEARLVYHCMAKRLRDDEIPTLARQIHDAPFDRAGVHNFEQLRILAMAQACPAFTIDAWKTLARAALNNPHFQGSPESIGFLHYQWHLLGVDTHDLHTAITQLDATWAVDPDPDIPRLRAQYLASAGLYQAAIRTLQQVDYARLPLLRRVLVNDRALNMAMLAQIRQASLSNAPIGRASSQMGAH